MSPEALQNSGKEPCLELSLQPIDNHRLANLSGQFDEHLHFLEKHTGVEIHHRGHEFRLNGGDHEIHVVAKTLQTLYVMSAEKELTMEDIHLVLREQHAAEEMPGSEHAEQIKAVTTNDTDEVVINTRYGKIKGRGHNQQLYLHNIVHHDINFGVGPAGTGKTYLAVACAIDALERNEVRRIVLIRPAVEAGERLGFLPGDLSQKVDPYLRPLYDALYEMMGVEKVERLIERNIIEIAPLAYMRGRTLNDAFIILDEAQNTTIEQMKMFLTRIGFSSTAVVTGDITQIDLPREHHSGLKQVIEVLKGVSGISFTFFQSKDVVRHSLVQQIVDAYEDFNHSNEK